MLTLNISQADIVTANYERIHNPIDTVRMRMDAIFWLSQGYSRGDTAELSGVHRNSVTTYIKLYHKGGLEALKTFKYKGAISVLASSRVDIEAMFRSTPPRSCKQAAAMILELTGQELSLEEVRRFMHRLGMKPRKTGHIPAKADPDRQQKFLNEQLLPVLEKARLGQCQLFFGDAAHFMMAPFVGLVWCFARIFIKAASGRNRINVLGALDVVTHKMETIVNTTYIQAETVVELLKKLAAQSQGVPIYLVLDNARYQHCNYVKEFAQTLNITLMFLPPYSPNLNLIERVWRYIKKDVLATRYFDCAQTFHQAIYQAVNDINHNPKVKHDLKALITPRFQTFAQNLMW
ncbi:MAG: IS630 family transposase [Saprospiraceae bacterium]